MPYKNHSDRMANDIKYRTKNRERLKEYHRKWEENNKDKTAGYFLKKKDKWNENRRKKYNSDTEYKRNHQSKGMVWRYGITLDDYENMVKDQKGVCAICRKSRPNKRSNKLFVDHNHKTDKIRELLCYRCNSALGIMDESIENLQAMIEYIHKWNNA